MSGKFKNGFVSKTLCAYGIKVGGLYYNSGKLQQSRLFIGPNSKVSVRFDCNDVTCVYVQDCGRADWFKVPQIEKSNCEISRIVLQEQAARLVERFEKDGARYDRDPR
jgi:hypothetical protein